MTLRPSLPWLLTTLAAALVALLLDVGNVDSVFVAGRAVKRGGKLVDADLKSVFRKLDAAAKPGASLLVVPASLIGNWKQELERFAPSLL